MVTFNSEKLATIEAAFQAIEGKSSDDSIISYVRATVIRYLKQQKRDEINSIDTTGFSQSDLDALDSVLNRDSRVISIDFDPIS